MSGPPPPGGFNPGAFEFRPSQGAPFIPRGQPQAQGYPGQQQPHDPYGQYGGGQPQGGYYPQQGGYPQYGQQQGGYPQQQAYVPPSARGGFQPRSVQGFQPPSFSPAQSSTPRATPPPSTVGAGGAPVSLSIGGGAPKAAPSLSIGGGAPKAAPSLSIGGGAPKAAPSLSIGGGAPKAAPSLSIGGVPKAAPSLSIGGAKKAAPAEDKKEQEDKPADVPAPAEPAPVQAETAPAAASEAPATETPVKAAASTSNASAPAASSTPAPASTTNFSKVSAKNDAEAVAKEQAAAGAEVLRDLYGDDVKDTNVKSHLNIIFTGHVDAGKSTMGGQLLYLTGAVDKRTMEKYEQEAKAAGRETWYLSWALDSGKEERAKGKTVEVGRAYFESEKRRYTILDAPGHKTYVPSMITGAAQADLALLVLSARKGEFETGFERDGQTREHAMLIKNNGINKLIVAVNKMDDPTVEWDQGRYDEICAKISPFLRSVGFNPKTDVTFIPVAAQVGENMKERIGKKAPWFEGPSLLEHLDNLEILDRDVDAPFSMPISEKYNELGSVVMGKIVAGRVKKGDSLLLMPNKTTVEVAAVMTESADEIDMAFCGDNIRLRLNGVKDSEVQPGYVLSSAQQPVRVSSTFRADISVVETKNIITSGYNCVLHIHTLAEEVTITSLLYYYQKKTRHRSKKPPTHATKGMTVGCIIQTSAPICIETFKDSKMLGRFTLRDEGRTVAIGKVIKLYDNTDQLPEIAKLSLSNA
ncbi:hypothetical protein IAU60_005912 [Kwoniella sp. DSM 27419]